MHANSFATVVIERLCFKNEKAGFGRRLKRLPRGFGQSIFKESLAQWSEDYGFTVKEVNAAYTSQTGSRCDFVHQNNRDAIRFSCLSCGWKARADVKAANNQRGRSVRERGTVPSSRPG
ncbi:zinc ribbon domain-containing protein [Paraburkholderia sediminicola]|uniref:zinc ribbon domain-containing protein n=1 Tax=Paraburkholderia sediminicola TaxID=458836 RepID=UPI0038BC2116